MISRVTQFSDCRKYRYTLWREWDMFNREKFIQFVCLNPSTADEVQDDPTIRRCIGFAKSWGFGSLCITNIFAWRETDSTKLAHISEPVGVQNDEYIKSVASEAALTIAAWGTKGAILNRAEKVKAMIPNLHCLRITADGFPEHPLYLPKTLKPIHYK